MTGFKRLSRYMTLCSAAVLIFFTAGCMDGEGNRMFDKAVEFWKRGDYDEALQNLIALTKSYPSHPLVDDALFLTAGIYHYYLDEQKNAIRFYRILNRNFRDSEYYYYSMINIAEIYENSNTADKQKAIEIYKILETLDDIPEKEYPIYRAAKTHMDIEAFGEARKYFKKLIENYPESRYVPQSYLMIGYSFYGEGMDNIAKLTFKEASDRFSDSDKALDSIIALANIYEESKDIENAIKTYSSAITKIEKTDSLYNVLNNRISLLKTRLKKIKR